MDSAGKERTVPPKTNHEIEKSGGVLEPAARRPAFTHASDLIAARRHSVIIPSSRGDKARSPHRSDAGLPLERQCEERDPLATPGVGILEAQSAERRRVLDRYRQPDEDVRINGTSDIDA